MAISDKSRKILWARSGNRCAICRQKLVIDETALDSESVIGEECHICARSPNGPRYDISIKDDEIDKIDNLILLCSIHHKMIDDQFETYSISILNNVKKSHEMWVEEKLKTYSEIKPISISRIKNNIPKKLAVVTSGKELMALASTCMGAYNDYSDNLTPQEVDLVGGFLQNIKDYMDIWDDIELLDQVRASMDISESIKELITKGFLLFAATEVQRMEGGIGNPSNWKVLHLSIRRSDDQNIRYSQINESKKDEKSPAK